MNTRDQLTAVIDAAERADVDLAKWAAVAHKDAGPDKRPGSTMDAVGRLLHLNTLRADYGELRRLVRHALTVDTDPLEYLRRAFLSQAEGYRSDARQAGLPGLWASCRAIRWEGWSAGMAVDFEGERPTPLHHLVMDK